MRTASSNDFPPLRSSGKERDTETGLDYFGARYFGSNMGRFTSADPKMISVKRILDPRGWNAYSYVLNNPLILVDPDGKEWKWGGSRSSAQGDALVEAFARNYQKDANFRQQFDKVAGSTKTVLTVRDEQTVPKGQVFTAGTHDLGYAGPSKTDLKTDSSGKVVGAAAVVHGAVAVDTDAATQLGKLDQVVKHEVTHGAQIDQDPVGYAETARTVGQFSKLETAAQNSETEQSAPNTELTLDQAREHVQEALKLKDEKKEEPR